MQMQGNQQPNRISDYDLMNELNACIKQSAMELTSGILESSSPQVRQQFEQSLQSTLRHHQQLSQLMVQKGYYKPLPASPEAFQVALGQIQTANAQIGGAMAPGGIATMPTGITNPTVGTGPVVPQTPRN